MGTLPTGIGYNFKARMRIESQEGKVPRLRLDDMTFNLLAANFSATLPGSGGSSAAPAVATTALFGAAPISGSMPPQEKDQAVDDILLA